MSKKRKKYDKVGNLGKRSLENVAVSIIKYMTLAEASRKYLKENNRFNPRIDFRLYVEADFSVAALTHFFKVTKSFIARVQERIRLDESGFKKEVEDFCDAIAPATPEKSSLVTKNLEGEMAQIIQRDKTMKKRRIIS